MDDLEHQLAIGRAVEHVFALAIADDQLRPAIQALARLALSLPDAEARPETAAPPELSTEGAEGKSHNEGETSVDRGDSSVAEEPEPVAEGRARRRRESRESVPMDPVAFAALVGAALRGMGAGERGTMAEALLGSGTDGEREPVLEERAARVAEPDDPDSVLPGIVTRARLRAAVGRDVAEHIRSGSRIDEDHLHRARSEGAAVWVTDVVGADPDDVATFAECLDALADVAELMVLQRRYEPTDLLRRQHGIREFAAVQSALRVAARALRETPDDDQMAAFEWLRSVTAAERVFVERHMRLDDPLDPGRLPEVLEPVHADLAVLKERADREAALRKRYQQVKYIARRLAEGKANGPDADKLVEAVDAMVQGGIPPSSLQLRAVLAPVADRLPSADGRAATYGRVLTDLHRHLDRVEASHAAGDDEEGPADSDPILAAIGSPRDAVRIARERLERVVIPPSALETIGELDGAPESVAWGRSTWRALRALHTYAEQADGHAGFWDWCANSGHPFAWPATQKKLAMSESETVMNAHLDDRLFEVDRAVAPGGRIVMVAHCKIAEGGGMLAPRLYFYDDTKGVSGQVHVGFIGPHKYVRNASTN